LQKDWSKPKKPLKEIHTNAAGRSSGLSSDLDETTDRSLAQDVKQKLAIGEGSSQDDHRDRRLSKVKKIKVKEVGETQTSKFSARG
jgi:checkpoint serine/threonine-protein kinase